MSTSSPAENATPALSAMTWYHASPTINRASILARGLLGTRGLGDGTNTVFAISSQPRALYLAPNIAEVRRYIEHVFVRWFPDARQPRTAAQYLERGARLASFDVWAVEVRDEVLTRDADWTGEAAWTNADFVPDRLRLVETRDLVTRQSLPVDGETR